ncbi:hypothetical protein [Rhodococcus opacus]|uniref:hypothetical protein n=1 Tax=Rhodococcus opacus TaxID=37919 RepID=UPI000307D084|nr:hypothetical protein [Rhodococcus opacus]UDH01293.1 hypothetical protein K2Z90_007765 [Rhodococcus opacus PD630]
MLQRRKRALSSGHLLPAAVSTRRLATFVDSLGIPKLWTPQVSVMAKDFDAHNSVSELPDGATAH